jgi:hypothetical protein
MANRKLFELFEPFSSGSLAIPDRYWQASLTLPGASASAIPAKLSIGPHCKNSSKASRPNWLRLNPTQMSCVSLDTGNIQLQTKDASNKAWWSHRL